MIKRIAQSGIILLFVAELAIPSPSYAQYWGCKMKRSRSVVYTNTPTVSEDSQCKPFSLSRAPYNKVPQEVFDRYADEAESILKKTKGRYVALRPYKKRKKKERARLRRARLSKDLYTNSHFKEVNPTDKRKAPKVFRVACEVSGMAKGKVASAAIISITRGALTVDTHRILLRQNFAPVHWETTLRGRCRRPVVRISWEE